MDDITITLTREERKAVKKAKNAEYYQKHKDELLAKKAEYYQKNKDEILAKRAEYRANNMEKIAEYMAEYRANHKEEKTVKNAEYYQKHKDEIVAKQAEYRAKNKDEIAAKNAEYYATPFGRANNLVCQYRSADKKRNRGECTIDAQWILDNIFTQSCHYCGETDWHKLGCDRIDNSKPHTPDNVVPCCSECNIKKNITPYDEFMRMIG